MNNNRIKPLSSAGRREFLRRAAATSALGAAAPMALNLSAMTNAIAAEAEDYKALVCVFLFGGNDHNNTLVPYDTANYQRYAEARGTLATNRESLASTQLSPSVPLPGGQQYALAPQLSRSHELWAQGKLGVQFNVGPLMAPTTLAQYKDKSVQLPSKVFSHNTQQSFWQTLTEEGAVSGWGGRLADRMLSQTGVSPFNCISISGNVPFVKGQQVIPTTVPATGSSNFRTAQARMFGSDVVPSTTIDIMRGSYDNLFMDEQSTRVRTMLDTSDLLTDAFADAVDLETVFSEGGLSSQLKKVAELISVRDKLGSKRQVFFVGLGGFDNHNGLNDKHPGLLSALDNAMAAFYESTIELGVSDNVTTFTASDFGRTLNNNGSGTDHGWGGHQMVMGGAVSGGRFYGTAPDIMEGSQDLIERGRLLPTTSIEQFGAALGRWYGSSEGDLADVFQRLDRFDQVDLGIFG